MIGFKRIKNVGKMCDFEEHRGLIWSVVNEFTKIHDPACDKDDLFQLGCIGYLKAVKNYDSKKGKFTSLAYMKIKGEILDSFNHARAKKRIPDKLKTTLVDDIHEDLIEPEHKDYETVPFQVYRLKPKLLGIVREHLLGVTFLEIGRRRGFTESNAHQLWKRALKILRPMFLEKK